MGSSEVKPYAYRDASNSPIGLFVDAFREAARRQGLTIEWVFLSGTPESGFASNRIDVHAGLFATEERRKRMFLSDPWWDIEQYILVKDPSPIWKPADLQGRRLLYSDAPPLDTPVAKLFPGSIPQNIPSWGARVEMVCLGQVEAGLISHTELSLFLAHAPSRCKDERLRLVTQSALRSRLVIASAVANQELTVALRRQLREMELDGALAAITHRYPVAPFQTSDLRTYDPFQERWIFPAFALMASLLAAVLWFSQRRIGRAKAEAALAVQSAMEASRAKEEFLAVISHEVRTPMNAVLGYMDLLRDTPMRPDQEQFVGDVCHATSSLLALMSDILDFSKLRSGTVQLQRVPFDVLSIIDEIISTATLPAEARNLELIVDVSPQLPWEIIGDPDRIRQIFANLVGNAIKFTEAGFVRISLNCRPGESSQPDTRMLEFSVVDTGSGIPPDQLKLIFEPFRQVDSSDSRRHGGIGLGLAIVNQLVIEMGGRIDVDSKPGFGSRFTVSIPVGCPDPSRVWADALRRKEREAVLILARPTSNVDVLRSLLTGAGIDTLFYSSESDAVADISHRQPGSIHWILAEPAALSNPDSFAAWVRGITAPHTPRIVLMGTVSALRLVSESAQGAFAGVLLWPVTPRSLKKLLDSRQNTPPPARREDITAQHAVLVVDDNPINRKVASALLSKLGCRVDLAENGRVAAEKCRNGRYSLILMDCQMPVMDGYAAAQHIRLIEDHGTRVPIIGVSASTEEDTQLRCLNAGMDGYIPKPITLSSLETLLGNTIASRE